LLDPAVVVVSRLMFRAPPHVVLFDLRVCVEGLDQMVPEDL
jgi:hypothetical protein